MPRGMSAEFLRKLRQKHGLGEFRKARSGVSTTRGSAPKANRPRSRSKLKLRMRFSSLPPDPFS